MIYDKGHPDYCLHDCNGMDRDCLYFQTRQPTGFYCKTFLDVRENVAFLFGDKHEPDKELELELLLRDEQ